ncbi:MAG: tryptophan--tRNA ligase [Mycoplasmoidaceae bacterium]|nr:tryptophan--tRNA ligase [Mycoplasmoidaceae bacterium]
MKNTNHKPIMLSGIQPSNRITLGNYLGAIKPYVQTSDMFDMYVFVADLHAITNTFDPELLAKNRKEVICMYYACGLDFNKVKIFYQSDVKSHTELAHILTCHTTLGELNRMTQFKDKAKKAVGNGTEMIPTGLLMYPVLMAADILLYDADAVIVGADQKQHMELARNIAERMNKKYSKRNGGKPLFVVPEPYILKTGARIMDLLDPSIKMSKSNINEKGTIFVMDSPEVVADKIKKAKTDSLNKVKYDKEKQPGISNLMEIYAALTGMSFADIEKAYKNAPNYGVFKTDLIKIVCDELNKLQAKFKEAEKIYDSKLLPILEKNAKDCTKICQDKTEQIYKAIGMK